MIDCVVTECKVCQKFEKSVTNQNLTLLKVASFNKIFTLKIWSFALFIKGKFISNKRTDIIIEAINNAKIFDVRIYLVLFL